MIIKHNDRDIAICTIVTNNSPLRETHLGTRNKKVRVTYNSEYAIMIRNQLSQRLLADVTIDGISLGDSFVVDGNSHLHLERFIDNDRRFKFVRYNGSGQEDSVQKQDAGVVTVKLRYNIPTPPVSLPWRTVNRRHFYGTDASQDALYTFSYCDQQIGTTVEGSKSDQQFHNINVNEDFAHEQIIRFQLAAADEPKNTCSIDHYTLRQMNHNYCNGCGTSL